MLIVMGDNMFVDEELNFFISNLEEDLDNILGNNKQDRILYFTVYVRNLHDGGFTYLESIAKFCEEHDIEYEDSVKLISEDLKSDLFKEAIHLNQLKNYEAPSFNF